jgi:hypothetical protein
MPHPQATLLQHGDAKPWHEANPPSSCLSSNWETSLFNVPHTSPPYHKRNYPGHIPHRTMRRAWFHVVSHVVWQSWDNKRPEMDKKVVCKMYHCLKRVGMKVLMLSGSFSSISTDHWNHTVFTKVCPVVLLWWRYQTCNLSLLVPVFSILHFCITSFLWRNYYISCIHLVVTLWHVYNKQSTVIQLLWSEGVWKFSEWQLKMRMTL